MHRSVMKKAARIFYIDNLRIFLIGLVVLHHLSITYGAAGGWYYREVEGDRFTTLLLTMFTATNQSFFMGLFFLISAYFTVISFERKPIGTFIKDRFVRLVIPLIIFYFIISPLTIFMKVRLVDGADYDFFEFVKRFGGFGFGPMWFVETLIYFSFAYILYKMIFRRRDPSPQQLTFPKPTTIICSALAIGAVSFAVRLWIPLGSELGNTGLQLPFFPQYIAMLLIGILFARHGWFDQITFRQGVKWFTFAQVITLVGFPLTFYFGTKESGIEPFVGGWTWQAATLAVWEQLAGFSIIIGLIGIFRQKLNYQGKWVKQLSGAAYAVFIIHPFVIVTLSSLLKDWEVYPVLKFVILAPLALFLCFGTGLLLKKIPVVNQII
jgi:glucans biosynthesis protein C